MSLSHLEKKIKETNPLFWVERINLSDLISSFKSCREDHFTKSEVEEKNILTDKCLPFLTEDCLKISNNFEKCLFREMLPIVTLLLDGLDEITEATCKDMCVNWIQGLAQTKISQIWISSRSHLQTEIEEKFGCLAYNLENFTREDQINFLVKYWKKELEIEDGTQTRNVANELIKHVSKAISASKNLESFTGIPLIMFMVAEIYKEQTTSFLEDMGKISTQDSLSIIGIYRRFCDLKLEKYCCENFNKDMPEYDKIFKMFITEHELLGAWHIFGSEFEDVLTKEQKKDLKELIAKIENGKERRGIIYGIQNGVLIFMHQSFAEYLAAGWFANQFLPDGVSNDETDSDGIGNVQTQKLRDFLWTHYCDQNKQNFRKMFDLVLAEKCDNTQLKEVFQSVILDKSRIFQITDRNLISQTDPLGRNVFHVCPHVSDFGILDHYNSFEFNRKDISMKDTLFRKTPYEYYEARLQKYFVKSGK